MLSTPIDHILERIIGSNSGELPPEVARFFLDRSLTEADQQRIDVLSEKANEGELTHEERDELAAYVLVGDFLSLVKSRARRSINNIPPAA